MSKGSQLNSQPLDWIDVYLFDPSIFYIGILPNDPKALASYKLGGEWECLTTMYWLSLASMGWCGGNPGKKNGGVTARSCHVSCFKCPRTTLRLCHESSPLYSEVAPFSYLAINSSAFHLDPSNPPSRSQRVVASTPRQLSPP